MMRPEIWSLETIFRQRNRKIDMLLLTFSDIKNNRDYIGSDIGTDSFGNLYCPLCANLL